MFITDQIKLLKPLNYVIIIEEYTCMGRGDNMRFIRTENLVKGMRLAKPIYNRNGVLLYDRDTKLTKQGINSIKNFNIIGIFILEPAEPLPPMTEEDIEFERFQTMSIFGLKEDIELIRLEKKPVNMDNLVKIIVKNYSKKDKKVNFMQNIRSQEDYVFKHCLNVAILSAMMGIRMKMTDTQIRNMVYAALIHDIGKLSIKPGIALKNVMSPEDKQEIQRLELKGMKLIANCDFIEDEVKGILEEKYKLQQNPKAAGKNQQLRVASRILQVAEVYDDMTAMKLGEEPLSDVVAIRALLSDIEMYDAKVVSSLIDSIKILFPGICVELTNGYTGLVIKANEENVLRPMVLCFTDNDVYNLANDRVFSVVQIKDIMKTMDKRVRIDKSTIEEYLKKYN